MKSVSEFSPEELAAWVCEALAGAGIVVTLTGGGCVSVWTGGEYVSRDLDFVEQGTVPRRRVRAVMQSLGFTEQRRYFSHADTEFVIEFPGGPLAVGDSPVTSVSIRRNATGTLRLLSPTDCVKDRLAAFFHWDDREALAQAVLVARAQPVELDEVRRWSRAEGSAARFEEFLRELGRGRRE